MSIQRLTFEYGLSQIGVRGNSPARLQIGKQQSQFHIQNGKAQLEINTQMPRFRGNRQRVNNESGLMDPLTFAKQFRDKGNRNAMQAAGNYARDGDFIANPRIPGDKSIPMLSKNKMNRVLGPKEKNIGLMPSSIPSLDWEKGGIEINASRQHVAVNWNGKNTVDVSAQTSYPVDVFLSRQPYFNVTGTVPNVSNSTYGRYIDRMV